MRPVIEDWSENWRTKLLHATAGAIAGGLICIVLLGLALGSCHDGSDGLCNGDATGFHRMAFLAAVAASSLVGPLLALPKTRKPAWIALWSAVGLLPTLLFVLSRWPYA